jgi:signal transduction histidine kinase
MNAPDPGADAGRAADAGAGHDPFDLTRLRQLAEEQAALRRVATLVAGGAQPAEVFSAVADELGRLIGAEATFVSRVDHPPGERGEIEGYLTVVGSYGRVSGQVPVGFRLKLLPGMVQAAALRTGLPARVNGEQLAKGPHGAWVGTLGMRAGVATPIVVGGRRWGVTVAATSQEDFPAGTESRMADFMELAATAIANARAEQELRELADTQAALRRLATLVARGEPPEVVFAAATREALRYFGGGTARMIRYELDGTATLVANEGTTGPHVRVGERWEGYPPTGLTATVWRTGQAARVDDYRDIPGGEPYLREGLRSAVAMPVHVDGRLWGVIAVGSGEGPLPPDTEQRMTEFTDLIATAVANAQNRAALEASRDELARLLAEQAALRRVATLVARGIDPGEIFSAVAEEIRRLLDADNAGIGRYEPDGTAVVVAGTAGDDPINLQAGTRVEIHDYLDAAAVWRTGRSAQIDEDQWSSVSDPVAEGLRNLGIRSTVASPIIVEGRLWGAVSASSRRGPFPPGTADRMADFTELIATAVGSAQSRAELAASRARIVAASDETRRRIERDLHDGTQQRLVSLGLELRLAQGIVPAELRELETEIGKVADELTGVLEDLREIARGIHPAILSEGGLGPALRTLARRAAIAVELDITAMARLPEPVEVAAYYVCSEALTNATRHAHASVVSVAVEERDDCLHLSIRDDGVGGADPARGSGLIGLRDRVEALGGSIEFSSPPGKGTLILVRLPLPLRLPDGLPPSASAAVLLCCCPGSCDSCWQVVGLGAGHEDTSGPSREAGQYAARAQ